MKHYEYADGNGNRYTIKPSLLAFDPVTPERSSSGTYSGGEPSEVSISPLVYDSLCQALELAIQNKSIHIPDRIMTSGAITTVKGTKRSTIIIEPGCEEQHALENLLRKLIQYP